MFLFSSDRVGPEYQHGTTVVVVWTPNFINIAADSKVTTFNRRGEPGSFNECKIHRVGNLLVVGAGLYAERTTDFDFPALAEKAIKPNTTPIEAAKAVKIAVGDPLLAAVEAIRNRDPVRSKTAFSSEVLDFVVAGLASGQPAVAGYGFSPDINGGFQIKEIEYPGDRKFTGSAMSSLLMGEHQTISRKYPGLEMQRFLKMNVISGIEELVQLEISNSDKVGPPVSVVTISSTSIQWVKRGLCK
jgi:hypothetical protein